MSALDEILKSHGLISNNTSDEAVQPEAGSTNILDQIFGLRKSDKEWIIAATADIEKTWKDLKNNAEHGFTLNAYTENFAEYAKLSIEVIEYNLECLWRIQELKETDPEKIHTLYLMAISRLLQHMPLLQAVVTCSAYSHNGLSKENLSALRSQAETATAELKQSKEKARKGGIKSGETRKTDADEFWKQDALKLAQTITTESPRISQEDLADQIRQRWTLNADLLPKSRSYIVRQICQWEREGKLKRTRLRRSKIAPPYTY